MYAPTWNKFDSATLGGLPTEYQVVLVQHNGIEMDFMIRIKDHVFLLENPSYMATWTYQEYLPMPVFPITHPSLKWMALPELPD